MLLFVLAVAFAGGPSWQAPRFIAALDRPRGAETSGLASSWQNPGILWTHDDSGGEAVVRGFDHRGQLRATVHLLGVAPLDWEDIAVGPGPRGTPCLFVGDIGDNYEFRPRVTFYRVEEPFVSEEGDVLNCEVEAFVIQARYEDGAHDAEALLVDPNNGRVHVVTKRGETVLWSLDEGGVLRRVAALPLNVSVTAGDFSPDGRHVVLLGVRGSAFEFDWTGEGVSATPPRVIPLPKVPISEAITFARSGRALYICPEGGSPPLWEIPSLEGSIAARLAHW